MHPRYTRRIPSILPKYVNLAVLFITSFRICMGLLRVGFCMVSLSSRYTFVTASLISDAAAKA
jgi:hypothetical protein